MGKGKPKKSKKKIIILSGIGVILLVVIGLVVMGSNKEEIISVDTEQVEARTITQIVTATGKINPTYQVMIRPEVTGEIVELLVEEGDVVNKNQLLIRLRPDQYIARRNRAQASLESAKATLKVREATLKQVDSEYSRVKGLFEKELASEKDLETAEALYLQSQGQYEAQKATVSQANESYKDAEVELAKTAIYSPINGTITALNVELAERVLGSSFSQGTHLLTVADLNSIEARVEVDENDIVLISVGDTAKVEIDAFKDQEFIGEVTQIGNSAQTTGFGTQNEVVNFEVRVKLIDAHDRIRPGMSCDADIETETKFNVLSIPIQCVTARMPELGGSSGGNGSGDDDEKSEMKNKSKSQKPEEVVFVVQDNMAKQVTVETGISDDNYVEVLSGLEGSEEIVSGPYRAISKELKNEMKVLIKGGKKSDKKDSDEGSASEDKSDENNSDDNAAEDSTEETK